MRSHDSDPLNPTTYDIMSFVISLRNQLKAPGSVCNYLSGARTWVASVQGEAKVFDTYQVGVLKRGTPAYMKHTPLQAAPITAVILKKLINSLTQQGDSTLVIRSAFLIAFFTMLRQSNLFSSSCKTDSLSHVLLRKNIILVKEGLLIKIISSKTEKPGLSQRTVLLPRLHNTKYCPVATWVAYTLLTTFTSDCDTAFMLPSKVPLTSATATKILRCTLDTINISNVQKFTLHSFRRGSVQTCEQVGATLDSIKQLGHWRSNAIAVYRTQPLSVPPQALLSLFG